MNKLKRRKHGARPFILWMVAPSLAFVLVFTYYPMIRGMLMAFQNYNLFNINNIKWIGLDNFRTLFEPAPGNMFYMTMTNTVKWVLISLFFQFMIGFLMALLLQRAFFGRKAYQAMIFFPWAVSGFTIGIMWRWMFNGTAGVINDLLIKAGILETQYGFLAEIGSAFSSVVIANVWYGIPFFIIMISAALQGVPLELYEAADVDGASAFVKFRSVTLPFIQPVLILTILLRVIWIFNFPQLIFAMTNGGPAGSSHILTSFMMEKVNGMDYGMGSAIGLVVILFLSVYTVFYLVLTKFSNLEET